MIHSNDRDNNVITINNGKNIRVQTDISKVLFMPYHVGHYGIVIRGHSCIKVYSNNGPPVPLLRNINSVMWVAYSIGITRQIKMAVFWVVAPCRLV
jgi:hypothetical protein